MAKERKIDMVILGLLSHDNLTGYDIKKQIDASISFFWKGSFGNIYPALASLEESGMIKKIPDKNNGSGRERIFYGITDAGRESLKEWLTESKTVNDLKYEMLLKVFFGGTVENELSIATIEEFEKDITRDLLILKTYKENLSNVLDERDHVFFYLTVAFGVETYEAYLRWCTEAKRMLTEKMNLKA